ncbi:hypothetical protein ACFV3R_03750 [Streptomyces sp. NPDC059740]|uniref:hypothetical protein n=1 Tax=Streptomyces sp. NPDC059740 TaxID=3346926 RepID=UPI003666AFBC
MSDASLQNDVLAELGEDRVRELAEELGTDVATARDVIRTTVASLPDEATDLSRPPELDTRTTPGPPPVTGVLRQITPTVSRTVAYRTGLPEGPVLDALELLLPVVLTVVARRSRGLDASGRSQAGTE